MRSGSWQAKCIGKRGGSAQEGTGAPLHQPLSAPPGAWLAHHHHPLTLEDDPLQMHGVGSYQHAFTCSGLTSKHRIFHILFSQKYSKYHIHFRCLSKLWLKFVNLLEGRPNSRMANKAFTILANCVSTIQCWWSLVAQLIAQVTCHHRLYPLVVSHCNLHTDCNELDDSETR